MISVPLERLVELRGNRALVKRLIGCAKYAADLLAVNVDEMLKGVAEHRPSAHRDAIELSEATALITYEEVRRPYVDFLQQLDAGGVLRNRPRLHTELKELLK